MSLQVSAALQANLAQEQQAFLQFYEELQTEQSPLKQLQEAQILVEIFPHRFESLWLCSVLAMEDKQGRAEAPQHGLGHISGPPGAGPPATSDPPPPLPHHPPLVIPPVVVHLGCHCRILRREVVSWGCPYLVLLPPSSSTPLSRK
ncbi:hypothetical protein COCOBI_14-0340 [Coccomyxa sp. Obi]|nr:hypothetical protein COCOBI_14-0340 [Coccomyxa sp. Obi]